MVLAQTTNTRCISALIEEIAMRCLGVRHRARASLTTEEFATKGSRPLPPASAMCCCRPPWGWIQQWRRWGASAPLVYPGEERPCREGGRREGSPPLARPPEPARRATSIWQGGTGGDMCKMGCVEEGTGSSPFSGSLLSDLKRHLKKS